MSRAGDLARLRALAGMMLDAELAQLRAATLARQATEARLAALAQPGARTDLPEIVEGMAQLTYQRWADARRAELNLVLSRQTAAWLDARESCRHAFGREQALRGLLERLPRPPS